jgi:WD40 repeat protein
MMAAVMHTTPFSTELEGKLAGGAQSTRLYRLLGTHSLAVTSAAFSGDGKRVTVSEGNSARIWDAESGKEIAILKGHDRRTTKSHIRTFIAAEHPSLPRCELTR